MSESGKQRHHSIDYIELNVTELVATKHFYSAAFGWRFNDYGPEYAGFVMPGGDAEAGGLNATGEGAVGGSPMVLLYSDDLDGTVAAVREAGGEVRVEPYAFPGGRRFHFADPSGNVLGVWSEA